MLVFAAEYQPDKAGKGRKFQRLPLPQLLRVKAFYIIVLRTDNCRMMGVIGLNDDLPIRNIPPSPTRDLHDERKRTLGGSKIGHLQAGVSKRNADQPHAGEI